MSFSPASIVPSSLVQWVPAETCESAGTNRYKGVLLPIPDELDNEYLTFGVSPVRTSNRSERDLV